MPRQASERGEYNRGIEVIRGVTFQERPATCARTIRIPAERGEILVTNSGQSQELDPQLEVTVADVAANRNAISQLVDVRELDEWHEGRIAGGKLIPMSEFATRVNEIDPTQPIIVYCRSGGRSLMVAEALQNAGFDARSMAGGILEWERLGYPVER